jgi:hypothetical protein
LAGLIPVVVAAAALEVSVVATRAAVALQAAGSKIESAWKTR